MIYACEWRKKRNQRKKPSGHKADLTFSLERRGQQKTDGGLPLPDPVARRMAKNAK
jgi:hypothetical protein